MGSLDKNNLTRLAYEDPAFILQYHSDKKLGPEEKKLFDEAYKLAIGNMRRTDWLTLAENSPEAIIEHYDLLKNKDYIKEVLSEAIKISPNKLYEFARKVKEDKNYSELKDAAIERFASNPEKSWEYLFPEDKGVAVYNFTREELYNIYTRASNTQNGADFITKNQKYFKDQHYFNDKELGKLVNNAKKTTKIFKDLNEGDNFSENRIARLNIRDDKKIYQLLDTKLSRDLLNYNIFLDYEKRDIARNTLFVMNRYHDMEDNIRFKYLNGHDSEFNYKILSNRGGEELYTSTFNGVFKDYLEKLSAEKKSLFNDISELNGADYKFLNSAAQFGKFGEVEKLLSEDQQKQIVNELFKTLGNPYKRPLLDEREAGKESFEAAMIINQLGKDTQFSVVKELIENSFIQNIRKMQVQTSPDPEQADMEKRTLDLLCISADAYYRQNKENINKENLEIFKKIDANPRYSLDEDKYVPIDQLVDGKNRHFQIHSFYDDNKDKVNDGKVYYKEFLSEFNDRKLWKKEDHKDYVLIRNQPGNGEAEMYIYVGKPERNIDPRAERGNHDPAPLPGSVYDGMAVEKIREDIKSRGGKVDIMVHRGHSYHADKTIEKTPEETNILILGGCSGNKEIVESKSKAPGVQVSSTLNTGVGKINLEIIKEVTNCVMHKQDVVWDEIYKKALSTSDDDRKNDYISPTHDYNSKIKVKYNELYPRFHSNKANENLRNPTNEEEREGAGPNNSRPDNQPDNERRNRDGTKATNEFSDIRFGNMAYLGTTDKISSPISTRTITDKKYLN